MKNEVQLSILMPTDSALTEISIIVPVFNEQEVLEEFNSRMTTMLKANYLKWELIYIDDGSVDSTCQIITNLKHEETRIGLVTLSRNFGKEAAISAGLKLCAGAAAIVIDVDLQDPPELIPSMVAAWKDGAEVVNMRRRLRDGETWFKKRTAYGFYRLINLLSETPIQKDVGDFRLLSRKAIDALNLFTERNRFMKGLFSWIGFRQKTIEYDRCARAAGKTKWPLRKLIHLAFEGITGFSTLPLRLSSFAGFISAFGAFMYALVFLIKTMTVGEPVKGFPTLIVAILLLGGLQLLAMGILGEYIGRLVIESKSRPLFLVADYFPASHS